MRLTAKFSLLIVGLLTTRDCFGGPIVAVNANSFGYIEANAKILSGVTMIDEFNSSLGLGQQQQPKYILASDHGSGPIFRQQETAGATVGNTDVGSAVAGGAEGATVALFGLRTTTPWGFLTAGFNSAVAANSYPVNSSLGANHAHSYILAAMNQYVDLQYGGPYFQQNVHVVASVFKEGVAGVGTMEAFGVHIAPGTYNFTTDLFATYRGIAASYTQQTSAGAISPSSNPSTSTVIGGYGHMIMWSFGAQLPGLVAERALFDSQQFQAPAFEESMASPEAIISVPLAPGYGQGTSVYVGIQATANCIVQIEGNAATSFTLPLEIAAPITLHALGADLLVQPGQTVDLTGIAPEGLREFFLFGADQSMATYDGDDQMFVMGLTFLDTQLSQVFVTAVPEPSSFAIASIALCALGACAAKVRFRSPAALACTRRMSSAEFKSPPASASVLR